MKFILLVVALWMSVTGTNSALAGSTTRIVWPSDELGIRGGSPKPNTNMENLKEAQSRAMGHRYVRDLRINLEEKLVRTVVNKFNVTKRAQEVIGIIYSFGRSLKEERARFKLTEISYLELHRDGLSVQLGFGF